MSDLSRLKDNASRAYADEISERYCPHGRRCGCWGRARMRSWHVVDALIGKGWTLTPPHHDAACEWCGRAIAQDDQGRWYAMKGAERGYDPLLCDAVDDGRHDDGSDVPMSESPGHDEKGASS